MSNRFNVADIQLGVFVIYLMTLESLGKGCSANSAMNLMVYEDKIR